MVRWFWRHKFVVVLLLVAAGVALGPMQLLHYTGGAAARTVTHDAVQCALGMRHTCGR